MSPQQPQEIFHSYAHEDEKLRDELNKHLANLKRQKVITDWYDRDISAGKEWDDEIKTRLNTANIILLLISPDFMNSDYSNDVEVKRAMERHEAGDACVIPVILRPVDWEGAPFSKLQALPTDAKPITKWEDKDEAFLNVILGIRKAIQELSGPSASVPELPELPRPPRVGFVARRDKDGRDIVERLREELSPKKNQLVALWGAGGVGKTTLAAEAVKALIEDTGQRLVWTSASGRANFSFSTLLDDIAGQLGRTDLRPLALEPKEAAVRSIIAAEPTLIVLDNFETISDEEQLLCANFLANRTRCSALITTRERVDGASLIPLSAMSPGEAQEFLKRLVEQTQDAQIFAGDVRQRIYETAEANPFIMEWVVAQIDTAQEPDTVLEELKHGAGDAAERVFDRSFNLPQLGDDGRDTLLALSLFTPSATREALAAVAGFGDDLKRVNEAISSLRALWLIKGIDQNRRLTIEGLTRTLATARLSKDNCVEFKQRFVAHFLSYAEAHKQTTSEDFDALEAEKDNVLNALDVAYRMEDWPSVMRIRDALEDFLDLRGYWDEAIQRGEQALQAARNAQSDQHIAHFENNVAIIYQYRGDLAKARQLYDESLEIKKKLGNQNGIAVTLHQLGRLAEEQGNLAEARRLYDESLEIAKKLGNQSGIARTLHQLAILAETQGDLAEARRLYDESLEIAKKLGDQSGIALTLHQLGNVAYLQGDLAEARRLYDGSLEIAKKLGDQSGIASTLHQLAILAHNQGDLAEARRLYDESLEIKKRLGNQSGIAVTLHQLGKLAEEQGDLAEAERLLSEALSIFERLNSPNAHLARSNLKRIRGES
ncbi:MAG TPA: tetratricopeptide repeat protein [Pyrinomonadaceae bacterium]